MRWISGIRCPVYPDSGYIDIRYCKDLSKYHQTKRMRSSDLMTSDNSKYEREIIERLLDRRGPELSTCCIQYVRDVKIVLRGSTNHNISRISPIFSIYDKKLIAIVLNFNSSQYLSQEDADKVCQILLDVGMTLEDTDELRSGLSQGWLFKEPLV